jgi:putative transposase
VPGDPIGQAAPSEDALERPRELFTQGGALAYLRADASVRTGNGSEFTTRAVREWLNRLSVRTLFIEPGSPWGNGYLEPFSGKLRDELPNVEMLATLVEAQVLLERWRKHYNTVRPHSSLGYRLPAPETIQPWAPGLAALGPPPRAAWTGQSTA